MSKVSLRASEEKVRRKVERTLEGTIVHQRQSELALGRWDFAVFGPSPEGKGAVLRVGAAEQMIIQQAGVYVVSLGAPESVGHPGMMSIEELSGGDVSEELRGLEVYHVAPLRPMNVSDKQAGPSLERMREKVFDRFGDTNIAIIETPDERAWIVSALKYLHECDELLPDPVLSTIRKRMSDTTIRFGASPHFPQ